jgi:hypothetical protein
MLQDYYKKNGIAPMVRILSKVTGYKLKHIYELFPSGPGKGACKMAGLAKPTGRLKTFPNFFSQIQCRFSPREGLLPHISLTYGHRGSLT